VFPALGPGSGGPFQQPPPSNTQLHRERWRVLLREFLRPTCIPEDQERARQNLRHSRERVVELKLRTLLLGDSFKLFDGFDELH
jgi:hypothetical protein